MATIFPGSASVNQEFNGYRFNGTTWDIIGQEYNPTVYSGSEPVGGKAGDIWIDSSIDVEAISPETILTINSASAIYLTKTSASTTYATKTELANIDLSSASAAAVAAIVDSAPATLDTLNELAAALNDDANFSSTVTTSLGNKLDVSTASATYLTQLSASTTYAAKLGGTFSGNITAPEVRASTKLVAQTVGGDEGGEILLGKAATNTTLSGDGVTIDVFQNRLRIFEQGGDARGGYIDVSTLGNGVATNLTPGMVLISSTTVSATATVNIDNCFSSAYDNYRIVFSGNGSSHNEISARYRTSGSTNSTSNYNWQFTARESTGAATNSASNTDRIFLGLTGATKGSITIDVLEPFATTYTTCNSINSYMSVGTNHGLFISGTQFNGTTSFDGISFYMSTGTITGIIKIYGYKN